MFFQDFFKNIFYTKFDLHTDFIHSWITLYQTFELQEDSNYKNNRSMPFHSSSSRKYSFIFGTKLSSTSQKLGTKSADVADNDTGFINRNNLMKCLEVYFQS